MVSFHKPVRHLSGPAGQGLPDIKAIVKYEEATFTMAASTTSITHNLSTITDAANAVPFGTGRPTSTGAAEEEANEFASRIEVFDNGGTPAVRARRNTSNIRPIEYRVGVLQFDPDYVRVRKYTFDNDTNATKNITLDEAVDLAKTFAVGSIQSSYASNGLSHCAAGIWFTSTTNLRVGSGFISGSRWGIMYTVEDINGNVFDVYPHTINVPTGTTDTTAGAAVLFTTALSGSDDTKTAVIGSCEMVGSTTGRFGSMALGRDATNVRTYLAERSTSIELNFRIFEIEFLDFANVSKVIVADTGTSGWNTQDVSLTVASYDFNQSTIFPTGSYGQWENTPSESSSNWGRPHRMCMQTRNDSTHLGIRGQIGAPNTWRFGFAQALEFNF